ncbi:MAG: hypothetical protein KA716_16860 [Gloeotrichia echinulata DEX184]|nr:hypothetical protein [Gloeotrichia echinulata DEX184]
MKKETKESLVDAVNKLNLDFNDQQLKTKTSSLENNKFYFPEWLNKDSLLAKLKNL